MVLNPNNKTEDRCLLTDIDKSEIEKIDGCKEFRSDFKKFINNDKGGIYMPVGIQSAGKTTVWRNFIEHELKKHNKEYDVIHPDAIRFEMLDSEKTGIYYDIRIEPIVWDKVKQQMDKCLSEHKHCIIDATNVMPDLGTSQVKYRDMFFEAADKYNVPIHVFVLKVDPEVAIYRDTQRKRKVGRNIIMDTYEKLVKYYPDLYEKRKKYENFDISLIEHKVDREECINMGGMYNELFERCDLKHIFGV